ALKISYRALLYKIRDAGLSPNRPNLRSMAEGNLDPQGEGQSAEESGDDISHLMPIAKVSNA
ncbi:MAG TPA: hypothetical protein VFB79_10225, partial [Candidatus Angelobacter sp.]|nr:hypothetical protein [Candidatus Angelobacter sp.]